MHNSPGSLDGRYAFTVGVIATIIAFPICVSCSVRLCAAKKEASISCQVPGTAR